MSLNAADPNGFAFGADYLACEQIGVGATGQVYRGVNRHTSNLVAIKFLKDDYRDDPQVVARFIAERNLLTSVKHPHLLEVIDLIADGGRLGIVMEYAPGMTLRQLLQKEGTLPADLALTIALQVLAALETIHAAGIIHRDIKPENIIISDPQKYADPGIKLADFGIASLLNESGKSLTQLIGTPAYLAPEYIQTSVASAKVDIYGLGISLYEMLAGSSPFLIGSSQKNAYTLGMDHIHTAVPEIPGLAPQIWDLLAGLLEKQPERRLNATRAAAQITQLLPTILGVPRLPKLESVNYHQETVHRPLADLADQQPGDVLPEGGVSEVAAPTFNKLPTLQQTGSFTVVKDLSEVVTPAESQSQTDVLEATAGAEEPEIVRSGFFTKKVAAAAIATTLAVTGGVLTWWFWDDLVTRKPAASTTEKIEVSLEQSQSPAGLAVARQAVWDPQKQVVEYSITYRAVKGTLSGSVLEVLQDKQGTCLEVSWDGQAQVKAHSPALTSLKTSCGYEISLSQVSATTGVTVKAQIPGTEAVANNEELRQWLKVQEEATNQVLFDKNATSTAYPLQRLQGLRLNAPGRVKQGEVVPVTVTGVWPGGEISETPVLISPLSGKPTSILQDITGQDLRAVRFSDRCAGALAISADGHAVSALHPAVCSFGLTVGNFEANEVGISIVSGGS